MSLPHESPSAAPNESGDLLAPVDRLLAQSTLRSGSGSQVRAKRASTFVPSGPSDRIEAASINDEGEEDEDDENEEDENDENENYRKD